MNLTDIENEREVGLGAYFMGFTPNVLFKRRPRLFERAEGNYLFGANGEKVFLE